MRRTGESSGLTITARILPVLRTGLLRRAGDATRQPPPGLDGAGVRPTRTLAQPHNVCLRERHRRTVLAAYDTHYTGRRPHRALRLLPPRPDHPGPDLHHERIRHEARMRRT